MPLLRLLFDNRLSAIVPSGLQTALAMRLKICALGKNAISFCWKNLKNKFSYDNILRNRGMSLLRLLFDNRCQSCCLGWALKFWNLLVCAFQKLTPILLSFWVYKRALAIRLNICKLLILI
jgi:hypothetical protein